MGIITQTLANNLYSILSYPILSITEGPTIGEYEECIVQLEQAFHKSIHMFNQIRSSIQQGQHPISTDQKRIADSFSHSFNSIQTTIKETLDSSDSSNNNNNNNYDSTTTSSKLEPPLFTSSLNISALRDQGLVPNSYSSSSMNPMHNNSLLSSSISNIDLMRTLETYSNMLVESVKDKLKRELESSSK